MKRISVVLTDDSEERLAELLGQTALSTNRLVNVLICNAVVSDVVKREPVASVGEPVNLSRVSAMLAQMTPAELTEFARQFVQADERQGDRLLDALSSSFEIVERG